MTTPIVSNNKSSKVNIRLFTTDHPDIPVSKKERIQYLDILRGIAILFIFVANIRYLSGESFIPEDEIAQMRFATLDYIMQMLAFIFVDGKFYSIFSILFGIGFAVQYKRMNKEDRVFVPFFLKRMLGLLLIGGIHLFFIWLGDILTLYAVLGFLLVFFRHFSNKKLLVWAAILLLMPVIHWVLMFLTDTFYPEFLRERFIDLASGVLSEDASKNGDTEFTMAAYYSITSFKEWIQINTFMPLLRLSGILMEGRIFKVLALFLVGIYAGRQILENNILSNTPLIEKIILWGLVIGLPMNLLRAWIEFGFMNGALRQFLEYMLNALALTPMALAYCGIVALIVIHRSGWLNWFAAVGRTALSNYLFQSIISISVFYGVGLGYAMSYGYTSVIIFALTLYIWQILFSTIWLRYFRFGPVEWIWRQLTYGRLIKLRKTVK